MPTTQEVLMAEQMRRQNSPLAQLAQVGGNIFQGYQKRQQAEGAKKGQAAAANFLNLAVQNPDKQDEYLTQALQADPQFVKTFFDTQKTRSEVGRAGVKSALDQEKQRLRQLEYEANLTRQELDRETNDLKRQELMNKLKIQDQKIAQETQKTEDIESKKESSAIMANEAATLAREIAGSPSLGSITGTVAPRIGTINPESQDLINKASRLQSLLTVDNLKLMSGVLTDRDIGFLTNVASGLNLTDNGILGSEKETKKRLTDIANKIENASKKVSDTEAKDDTQPQEVIEWGAL